MPTKKSNPKTTKKAPATKAAAKAAKPAVPAKADTPAKTPKPPKPEGKLSQLDAAIKVLTEAGIPMATKAMIEAMATKGFWTSPGGATPHATLYSAILRELQKKGVESRFTKVDRGLFKLNPTAKET